MAVLTPGSSVPPADIASELASAVGWAAPRRASSCLPSWMCSVAFRTWLCCPRILWPKCLLDLKVDDPGFLELFESWIPREF